MDIRYFGIEWYEGLKIDNKYDKTYVMECSYEKFNKNKDRVYVRALVLDELLEPWTYWYTLYYGGYGNKLQDDMVEVTKELLEVFPEILLKE
jgi:hypothetical protein